MDPKPYTEGEGGPWSVEVTAEEIRNAVDDSPKPAVQDEVAK